MAYWLYCIACQQWSKSATPLSDDKSCSFCNKQYTNISGSREALIKPETPEIPETPVIETSERPEASESYETQEKPEASTTHQTPKTPKTKKTPANRMFIENKRRLRKKR
jgi:hypothetical protein